MDEKGFYQARAVGRLVFAAAAALLIAACGPFGSPPDVGTQPTIAVSNLQDTTRQPAYPGPTGAPPRPTAVPSPVPPTSTPPPPAPLAITLNSPADGQLVGSPVVINGQTDRMPRNNVLKYHFADGAGQDLGSGEFPVNGASGGQGNFNMTLNFRMPRDGGRITMELSERSDVSGQPAPSSSIGMVVDAQYQAITIDTPPENQEVGSPMVFTGSTARPPHDGSVSYRVLNSAGQEIGADAFPVGDNPGGPRPFNANLFFDYPLDGDTLRVELYDRNPATGAEEAMVTRSLVALPVPQQISFETPPAMTLVGSPVVITGWTTRYPFDGDLSYRVLTSATQQIGAGRFPVSGPAGQPATFNASPTFQIPRDGGTIHMEVFDVDPSNGDEIANSVLDMDVLAQYQAIRIDTPQAGTQVGSPVVLTGRTNRYPNSGQLNYRVVDYTGTEIGAGDFAVDGAPGQRGSFNASLTFAEPANGGNIRVELSDQTANVNTPIDQTVAAPPPQEIMIDTPAAGTQVGSPVVITGRVGRYPSSGKLNYRVLSDAGAVIGSGQLDVAPDSAGSRAGSFDASLTFAEPPGGGTITVEIYAPSPVSSGIVSVSISLYVAPRS
jgi:hypothetical protein